MIIFSLKNSYLFLFFIGKTRDYINLINFSLHVFLIVLVKLTQTNIYILIDTIKVISNYI